MKRLVCIGDSITYGQKLDDRRCAWPSLIVGYQVHSFGEPGDTTRLGLERFPATVQKYTPDIAIIQFGHNDANRWETDHGLHRVSPAAYEANLDEMVTRTMRFGALPLLCSITPSRRSPQHEADSAYYDSILRSVAAKRQTMVIDVRSAFLNDSDLGQLLMPDGIHLTTDGHRLYADVVQRTLDAWR